MAKGVLLYTGNVAILVSTNKMPITCKWAKNYFDDTNNRIRAILSDPEVVLDGIAQGVSDTVDNKGFFYSVGYTLPSIFGDKGLDKFGKLAEGLGGTEGAGALSKISKSEEVLKAGNVESKVTEGVKGLGGTKGIGKVEGIDGTESSEVILDRDQSNGSSGTNDIYLYKKYKESLIKEDVLENSVPIIKGLDLKDTNVIKILTGDGS